MKERPDFVNPTGGAGGDARATASDWLPALVALPQLNAERERQLGRTRQVDTRLHIDLWQASSLANHVHVMGHPGFHRIAGLEPQIFPQILVVHLRNRLNLLV